MVGQMSFKQRVSSTERDFIKRCTASLRKILQQKECHDTDGPI